MVTTVSKSGKGQAARTNSKISKRPRASSSSGSSDGGSSDGGDDRAAMLAALEAHGRAMFGMSGPEDAESSEQARRRMHAESETGSSEDDGDDDDEVDDFESDDGWGEGDEMFTDSEDEEVAQATSLTSGRKVVQLSVPEVIFAPGSYTNPSTEMNKAEKRAFLKGTSAKMMGIKPTLDYEPKRAKRARLDGTTNGEGDGASDGEEDQSNLKLDKTLHNMLLTTLLPSADASNAQRPVDKRKAMSGRLLELAKFELPGEGSKSLSIAVHGGHSAKIKTGIAQAQAKRDKKAREQAEAAGNYVKRLGGLGGEGRGHKADKGRGQRATLGEDVGKKKGMDGRKGEKRERGLGVGFGKFEGGMLKLSEREIARGSAEGGGGRGGRGRGRGGKGGRGSRGGQRGKR